MKKSLLLLFFLLVYSCKDQVETEQPGFFFSEPGKVYIYTTSNGSEKIYIHIDSKNDSVLAINDFGQDSTITDLLEKTEFIIKNNYVSAVSYAKNISGCLTKFNVYSDTIFMNEFIKGKSYLFESSVNIPEILNQILSKKVIEIIDEDMIIGFLGKQRQAIKLRSGILFYDGISKEKTEETELVYAQGLGLFSFQKEINGIMKQFTLSQITNYDNFIGK
ncbi:hypothetical protein MASR1M45_17300 [Candidatus Kapaibacterium sp.]